MLIKRIFKPFNQNFNKFLINYTKCLINNKNIISKMEKLDSKDIRENQQKQLKELLQKVNIEEKLMPDIPPKKVKQSR